MALSSQLRITIIAESRQAIRALKATQSAVSGITASANAANKKLAASTAAVATSANKMTKSVAASNTANKKLAASAATASASANKMTKSTAASGAAAEVAAAKVTKLGASLALVGKGFTSLGQAKLGAGFGSLGKQIDTVAGRAKAFGSQIKTLNTHSFSHLHMLQAMPNAMMRWGKSMQWVGRVLETRITFPLVALAGFASYFAFGFEKAMTRIRKVYGDASSDSALLAEELKWVEKAVIGISDQFGINADEVANMTAEWAQAGATGDKLIKLARLTSELSLLGDMDIGAAQQGLLTIMGAYKFSVDELRGAVAALNVVENDTRVSMEDLIEVIQTAGATAEVSGVAFEELAGMAAALVPITGTASEAGNALKSTIPRIMKPTAEALKVFRQMGIEAESAEWRMKTLTQRMDIMSVKFDDLSDAEQVDFSRVFGNLRQINKVVQLFKDRNAAQSQYGKVLRITNDAERNSITYQKELATLMLSSPQAITRGWVQVKNAMLKAALPLLPIIGSLLGAIAQGANAFNNLDASLKRNIFSFGLLFALMGPIVGYVGTIAQLFSRAFSVLLWPITTAIKTMTILGGVARTVALIVSKAFLLMTNAVWRFVAAVAASPYAMAAFAIAAGLAVLYVIANWEKLAPFFRDTLEGIGKMFQTIWSGVVEVVTKAVWALPEPVARALSAVVDIVKRAAMAIFGWLSYLNPFARHSPSIVDEVERGAKKIGEEYQSLARSLGVGVKVPILGMFSTHVQNAPMGTPAFASGGKLPASEVGGGFKTNGIRAIVGEGSQYPEYVIPTDPKYRRRAKHLTVAAAGDVGLYAAGGLLPRLRDALSGVREQVRSAERSETIQLALDLGVNVDVIGEAIDQLQALERTLESIQEELDAQQWVVDYWKRELDEAVDSVKAAEKVLDGLKDTVSDLEDQLTESRNRMSDWLDAPLEGSYAFADALFANEQAQKSAQLELLRLEETFADAGWTIQEVRSWVEENASAMDSAQDSASGLADSFDTTGMSVDDIKAKINALSTEITHLQGRENDLRLAGAGSDVLAGIRSQIKLSQDARKALAESIGSGGSNAPPQSLINAMSAVDDFESQLDDLNRQGQIIDLEQALALGPLQNEIEKTQRIAEQSFTAIMAGISAETDIIAGLEGALETATGAMEAQQSVVDGLAASKDVIQAIYDEEIATLDVIQGRYDLNADAASKLRAEIDLLTSAHSNLISAATGGGGSGSSGGLGVPADFDFDSNVLQDLLGGGIDTREFIYPASGGGRPIKNPDFGKSAAQVAWEQMADDFDDAFEGIDPFKPLQDAWDEFVVWWETNIEPAFDKIKTGWGNVGQVFEDNKVPIMTAIGLSFFPGLTLVVLAIEGIKKAWNNIATGEWDIPLLTDFFASVEEFGGWLDTYELDNLVWQLILDLFDDIKVAVDDIVAGFETWNIETDKMNEKMGPLNGHLGTLSAILAGIVAGGFLAFIVGLLEVLGVFIRVMGAAWRVTLTTIGGIIQILWGLVTFLTGVFSGDTELALSGIGTMWEGLKTIVSGVATAIETAVGGISSVMSDLEYTTDLALAKFAEFVGLDMDMVLSFNPFRKLSAIWSDSLNGAIGVVNTFSRGVNVLAGWFGIGSRIPIIGTTSAAELRHGSVTEAASGAVLPTSEVGGGFMVNRARAIVGEGSRQFPEYVIPTDPRYRGRAQNFVREAAERVGVDTFATGGIIGAGINVTQGLISKAKDKWKSISSLNMNGVSSKIPAGIFKAFFPRLMEGARVMVSKWFDAAAERLATAVRGSIRSIEAIAALSTGNVGSLANSIVNAITGSGGPGHNVGTVKGGGAQPTSIIGGIQLASGGLVRGGRGGVLAHIGEGRNDELVLPLPLNSQRIGRGFGGTERTFNFYGDLSFPNIESSDDMAAFVEELEALAS